MSSNPEWERFLYSRETEVSFLYSKQTCTYQEDYQRCKKDFEKSVPRAIEYMLAFAKFRLTS